MPDESIEGAGDGEATPNRDRRREPLTIEGEMVGSGSDAPDGESARADGETERGAESEPLPSEAGGDAVRPLLSAAIGALVGAAVAAGGLWYLNPRSAIDAGFAARLGGLDKGLAAATSAEAALDGRVGALEAAMGRPSDKSLADSYERRIAALELSASSVKGAADANHEALSEARGARAEAAKALALAASAAQAAAAAPAAQTGVAIDEVSALEARLDKLQAGLKAQNPAPVDLAPLNHRIDKIEAALAAQETEASAAERSASAARDWPGVAVVAQALAERLRAGAPFPSEEAALERLGVDPAGLARLKPWAAKGAPTAGALAAQFAQVAPAVRAAGARTPDGAVDRLLADMGGLVKVTPVGEVAGDAPSALLSQIAASLNRGQLAAALAAWERLPEGVRAASREWADATRARITADEAAQNIIDEAIAHLAGANN